MSAQAKWTFSCEWCGGARVEGFSHPLYCTDTCHTAYKEQQRKLKSVPARKSSKHPLKFLKHCAYCRNEFPTASIEAVFCTPDCGTYYRNLKNKPEQFIGPPKLNPKAMVIDIKRLQRGQGAMKRARELKDEIAAMKLSTSEHTAEELEAIAAQERERARQGRTRVVGYNGGGPSE
jgi:hypothetical protein